MNFNKIYTNGCSFTCGGGLHWEDVKEVYRVHHNIEIDNHLHFSYPFLLSKKLGVGLINDAVPGGSSNRLVRTTYKYLFENKNDLINTLFILEIPPFWRDEMYSNELGRLINLTITSIHSYFDVTDYANGNDKNDLRKIHDNLTNYFYNFIEEKFEKNKMMINIFGLISYMKLLNLKFILIDSGDFRHFLETQNLTICKDNFLWFDSKPLWEWMNMKKILIKNETNNLSKDEHLGIEGNKIVSNVIYEYIKENKTSFG
jgi:hypothetical protein